MPFLSWKNLPNFKTFLKSVFPLRNEEPWSCIFPGLWKVFETVLFLFLFLRFPVVKGHGSDLGGEFADLTFALRAEGANGKSPSAPHLNLSVAHCSLWFLVLPVYDHYPGVVSLVSSVPWAAVTSHLQRLGLLWLSVRETNGELLWEYSDDLLVLVDLWAFISCQIPEYLFLAFKNS